MTQLAHRYRDTIVGIFDAIIADADGSLARAVDAVARALAADRLIHVAGSGHSHMLAEEVFYRAGGIAAAQALLDPELMLHEGARASSAAERREGKAAEVLARYTITPGDVVFIASNSGRNAYPIELAVAAQTKGATTIAITSRDMARHVTARHPSGMLLCDLAEIVIDNHVPTGDATLAIAGLDQRMGPVSTLAGVFILNTVLAEAVARLAGQGIRTEIYQSANAPGDSQTTPDIAQRWQHRIAGL